MVENGKYRRKVFEIIEQFCESVCQNTLQEKLPYLHCNSWDEIIEERFVNKNCGYPTCNEKTRNCDNRQMYHIDRFAGKIYENCKQRDKFCSNFCFENYLEIRQQLSDEALWITGETNERMEKKFHIPNEISKISDLKSEKSVKKSEKFKKSKIKSDNVQVVEDSLIAKMTDLRIREIESSSETEDNENDEFKNIQPYEKCSDDDDFIESVQNFMKKKKRHEEMKNENLKKTIISSVSKSENKKEEEIFRRLRNKYSKEKLQKPPVLIEALPQKMSMEKNAEKNFDLEWLQILLTSWITTETRKLLHDGFRAAGGDSEKILMEFLSGKQTKSDETGLILPNLDKYNVHEQRLKILLQSIKPAWLQFEQRLHLQTSRRDILLRVVSTFNLTSVNVTGWRKTEINAIILAIFLLICHSDYELQQEYCPSAKISSGLQKLAEEMLNMNPNYLEVLRKYIWEKVDVDCSINSC